MLKHAYICIFLALFGTKIAGEASDSELLKSETSSKASYLKLPKAQTLTIKEKQLTYISADNPNATNQTAVILFIGFSIQGGI